MASVYKKRGAWWIRVRDARGIWRDRPAKARTKPAAQQEALEAQQFAHRQRNGLAPAAENMRRYLRGEATTGMVRRADYVAEQGR